MAHHSARPHTDLPGRHRGTDHLDAKSHHGGRTGLGCDDPGLSGHHSSRRTAGTPAHRLRLRCGRPTHALDHWRHVYFGSGRRACCFGHDTHPKPILAGSVCVGPWLFCYWCGHRRHGNVAAGVACQASRTRAKAGRRGTGVVHDDHWLRSHRRRGGTLSGSLLPRAPHDGHRHRVGAGDPGDVGGHPGH